MPFHLVLHHQFEVLYIGCQVVARVLHVCAYSEIGAHLRVVEPVLALRVISFLLFCVKCRCKQRQGCVRPEMARYAERAEQGPEYVFLASVEIYAERFYVFQRSERCLTVCGSEVVVVFRYVAYQVDRPPLVWPVTYVSLIIEEVRVILSFGVERAEQIPVCLVSDAVAHGELLIAETYVCPGAEQRCRDARFELLRTPVCYVESRRHLVAILRLKSARRESYRLYHVRIDDAETLLLSASYQKRAVYLHVVDVHGVLVETSAPDIILRRHLIVGRHSRLLLYQFLHGVACSRGHSFDVFYVQPFGSGRLAAFLADYHLPESGHRR